MAVALQLVPSPSQMPHMSTWLLRQHCISPSSIASACNSNAHQWQSAQHSISGLYAHLRTTQLASFDVKE